MNNTLLRISVAAGFLASGLLACARTPAADPERVTLESAIQRWTTAVNAQDVVTLHGAMTEDVELSDATTTAAGRDATIRALGEATTSGKLVVVSREITIANDIAWHSAMLSVTQKNGDVRTRGQALEIWKRVNGEWKLHRRLSAEVSPRVSLTRPSTSEPVLDRPRQ